MGKKKEKIKNRKKKIGNKEQKYMIKIYMLKKTTASKENNKEKQKTKTNETKSFKKDRTPPRLPRHQQDLKKTTQQQKNI